MPSETPYKPKIAPKNSDVITRDTFDTGEFIYPGKLVFNEKTICQREGTANGLLQWEQVIEQQHRVFSDGNPGRQFNSLLLQNPKTGGPIWKGSDADLLAEAYEELIGCDMLPDTEGSEEFVNHFFMFKSVKVPNTEKVFRQIPVEYLGPEYKFEGKVEVIGQSTNGPAPAEDEGDAENATALATLLSGLSEADIRGGAGLKLVSDSEELKAVKTVLSIPLRGGLVKPKAILLDKLIGAGLVIIDDDGVVRATEEG